MTKQRWMAVTGIVISALCSWALRRWASNGDVHAVVDLVRDVLPLFGLTFAGIGIVGGKKPDEEPKMILPGEISKFSKADEEPKV